jgi:hypothetical protein
MCLVKDHCTYLHSRVRSGAGYGLYRLWSEGCWGRPSRFTDCCFGYLGRWQVDLGTSMGERVHVHFMRLHAMGAHAVMQPVRCLQWQCMLPFALHLCQACRFLPYLFCSCRMWCCSWQLRQLEATLTTSRSGDAATDSMNTHPASLLSMHGVKGICTCLSCAGPVMLQGCNPLQVSCLCLTDGPAVADRRLLSGETSFDNVLACQGLFNVPWLQVHVGQQQWLS